MLYKSTKDRLKGAEILITGGTGSFGKTITKILKTECEVKGIRIYSRDEFKQFEFKNELDSLDLGANVSFLIGDVANKDRLKRACEGVDYIISAAAMKQVPACEYNPKEAIKTNVLGAENVIDAALDCGVTSVMHISTDKCVAPLNLYGMTKGTAEKLYLHANVYTGDRPPYFSCCRYGNVLGSRGSIIPVFLKQKQTGVIKITHPDMTRFWIRLETVAEFVLNRLVETTGKDIFVPIMKSKKVIDLAKIIAPEAKIEIIGVRRGEKIHEVLISHDESLYCENRGDYYRINYDEIKRQNTSFEYTSNNAEVLTDEEMTDMIKDLIYV